MTNGGTCLALPVEFLPLDVSENFFDLQLVSEFPILLEISLDCPCICGLY